MNKRRFFSPMNVSIVLTIFALLLSLVSVGIVLAQRPVPATEPGATSATSAAGSPDQNADGGVISNNQALSQAQAATEGGASKTSEGQPSADSAADANPNTPNDVSPQNVQAVFSYYYVAGTTLQPRDSATTYDYSSVGCSYTTAGTDRIMNTELHIPAGSIIKYLRIYYNDTSAAANVVGYITRYNAGTAADDVINVSSSGSAGFGTALSAQITHTVDNTSYAYTLIGWPGASSSQVQICGLRVAYYAPTFPISFLPTVRKQ